MENLDNVRGGVTAEVENADPIRIAVDYDKVGLGRIFKEVSTDILEWVGWVDDRMWWR